MKIASATIATCILLASQILNAEEHIVKAVGVKFEPLFVFVQPGDTITWTNMPAHLVESIDAMMPEDAEKLLTPLGENYTYRIKEKSGIHMYKCTPHWGTRMGGGFVIGSPENAEEILEKYMAEIEKDGSLKPAKGLIKKLRKAMQKEGMI